MTITPWEKMKVVSDLTCALLASGHYTRQEDPRNSDLPTLLRLDDESPPYAVEDAIELARFLFKGIEKIGDMP